MVRAKREKRISFASLERTEAVAIYFRINL